MSITRSYLLWVVLQALGILVAVGLVLSATVILTKPWWGEVQSAPLRPAGQWRPYLLPGRDLWCWWPDGWTIREEARPGSARVVFEAGATARVTVIVTGPQEAVDSQGPVLRSAGDVAGSDFLGSDGADDPAARALGDILQGISGRLGFWRRPIQPVTTRLGEGRGVFFSHWNVSGLRPIAWYGWLCAVSVDERLVLACATCDGENIGAFAWPAVRLIKSLRAWSGRDLTPEETGPSPEEEAKRAQAQREARDRAMGSRAMGGGGAPSGARARPSPPAAVRAEPAGGQSGHTAAPGARGPQAAAGRAPTGPEADGSPPPVAAVSLQTPSKPTEPTVKEAAGPASAEANLAPENRAGTAPDASGRQEGTATSREPGPFTPPPPTKNGKAADSGPATDTDE